MPENVPLFDPIGTTFNFFGGGGGLGPFLGVNGELGGEYPRVPDALIAATRKRYHRPGFSRFLRDTLVLKDKNKY